MSLIEAFAAALTLISVLLTSHLKKALYPVGLLATGLYAVVFWNAQLYASAALQVWFVAIQLYGWWFWSRGDRGREPRIGTWGWGVVAALLIPATLLTLIVSLLLARLTDAAMPVGDTAILSLSVLAQFLLDRKQMRHWAVWAVTDVIAIGVYGAQGLWITAGLYVLLLINVGYGWMRWRRALRLQQAAEA
ncbi:nicotinamide riboside transporter PnuC [Brevundimonas sp. M20]|uniref:nicotinamide riboside transporter PnuC n=1 Tax=Brevundimonas sp. M20 TaxID=2591463 RepID=UPI00143D8D96|nr:nicotinamide riboside transporter PnuC [Brevundimonas sp. M20]